MLDRFTHKCFLVNWSPVRLTDRPAPKTLNVFKSVGLPRTVCSFVCDFIALKIKESELTFNNGNFCKCFRYAQLPYSTRAQD